MDQAAEGQLPRHFDLDAVEIPLRLFVALGDAQEKIARCREAPRERPVRERAKWMPEPAARPFGHEPQRRQRHVLGFVKTVKHSKPCSCRDGFVITELRHCRIALSAYFSQLWSSSAARRLAATSTCGFRCRSSPAKSKSRGWTQRSKSCATRTASRTSLRARRATRRSRSASCTHRIACGSSR